MTVPWNRVKEHHEGTILTSDASWNSPSSSTKTALFDLVTEESCSALLDSKLMARFSPLLKNFDMSPCVSAPYSFALFHIPSAPCQAMTIQLMLPMIEACRAEMHCFVCKTVLMVLQKWKYRLLKDSDGP